MGRPPKDVESREDFLKHIYNGGVKFNMTSCGSPVVDEKVKAVYGDWKDHVKDTTSHITNPRF